MGWTLDKNRPIYLQLVETLQSRIVSGAYPLYSYGDCPLYLSHIFDCQNIVGTI